jgi:hypothetical protein
VEPRRREEQRTAQAVGVEHHVQGEEERTAGVGHDLDQPGRQRQDVGRGRPGQRVVVDVAHRRGQEFGRSVARQELHHVRPEDRLLFDQVGDLRDQRGHGEEAQADEHQQQQAEHHQDRAAAADAAHLKRAHGGRQRADDHQRDQEHHQGGREPNQQPAGGHHQHGHDHRLGRDDDAHGPRPSAGDRCLIALEHARGAHSVRVALSRGADRNEGSACDSIA